MVSYGTGVTQGPRVSVGQTDRFVHVAPKSLCPGPKRPIDTRKVVGNTGNHLRSKPKIWIFVDFQAKSRLYAIAQTLKLQEVYMVSFIVKISKF